MNTPLSQLDLKKEMAKVRFIRVKAFKNPTRPDEKKMARANYVISHCDNLDILKKKH